MDFKTFFIDNASITRDLFRDYFSKHAWTIIHLAVGQKVDTYSVVKAAHHYNWPDIIADLAPGLKHVQASAQHTPKIMLAFALEENLEWVRGWMTCTYVHLDWCPIPQYYYIIAPKIFAWMLQEFPHTMIHLIGTRDLGMSLEQINVFIENHPGKVIHQFISDGPARHKYASGFSQETLNTNDMRACHLGKLELNYFRQPILYREYQHVHIYETEDCEVQFQLQINLRATNLMPDLDLSRAAGLSPTLTHAENYWLTRLVQNIIEESGTRRAVDYFARVYPVLVREGYWEMMKNEKMAEYLAAHSTLAPPPTREIITYSESIFRVAYEQYPAETIDFLLESPLDNLTRLLSVGVRWDMRSDELSRATWLNDAEEVRQYYYYDEVSAAKARKMACVASIAACTLKDFLELGFLVNKPWLTHVIARGHPGKDLIMALEMMLEITRRELAESQ